MRVLLAYDDSDCARTALELTCSLPWPAGSSVEVLHVLEPLPDLIGAPEVGLVSAEQADLEGDWLEAAHAAVDGAVERLRSSGHVATGRVLRGRPASVIAREAEQRAVDLIVIGSRGHGQMDALLLGSVSTELADHAHCPVLVIRGDQIRRVIVATDGSVSAAHAIGLLVEWGILRGTEGRVVSVARSTIPVGGLAAAFEPRVAAMEAGLNQQLIESHRGIAQRAAERLEEAGMRAVPDVLQGDAATEIVRAARDYHADLIVTGSRGLGTLPRLLLGSVARKVLLHAGTSVLVMRPHPALLEERAPARGVLTAAGG